MDKKIFLDHVYGFIKLISLYLHNEKSDIEIDDKTLSFYIRLAKAHSLRALLYKAIIDVGVKVNKDLRKELEEAYLYNVRKTVMFEKEREDLYKYLNDNQIDYLPLKGLIIRNYYPDIYTREYADYDILFDDNGKKLIRDFFKTRGYEVKQFDKSNHDVYVKNPFYNFEMHRLLFNEIKDYQIYNSYFADYLLNSPIKENKEHYLKDEDFYIYFTTHSYKHFSNGGCGIRTLVDFYLFLKKTKLDFSYIDSELEKIDCLDFSKNFSALANKLFDIEPLNEDEEEMLLFIASSGSYGTIDHSVEKGIKKRGRFGYIMSRLFPPMSAYRIRYPWAYKCKILIPIAWFMRICTALTKNNKKTKSEIKAINKA